MSKFNTRVVEPEDIKELLPFMEKKDDEIDVVRVSSVNQDVHDSIIAVPFARNRSTRRFPNASPLIVFPLSTRRRSRSFFQF
jgi:hypothetical protein